MSTPHSTRAEVDPAAVSGAGEGDPVVSPFGIPASRLPVLTRPLAASFAEELRAAGVPAGGVLPGGARLAGSSGVWANAAAVRALIDGAGPAGARMVLRAPGWAAVAGGAERRAIDLGVVPPGADANSRAVRDALAPLEIDAGESGVQVSEGPEAFRVAAPRCVACEVRSWPDLLFTNLFGMASRVRAISPVRGTWIVLGAMLRARSLSKWRIAGKLVARGRGCDIHPSAVVEASVLGDGVRIGPGAVVRGAMLGAGVEVEELALVVGSVVGARSRVQRQAMLKFSVTGEEVSAGGTAQLSIFGDRSAMRLGSYTLDRRLDGTPVRVRMGEGPHAALVESGPALGVALGPGASIGSGVWIGAGRAVPAGVVLVRGPGDVVTRIPDSLPPGVYAVENGTLAAVRPREETP